MPCQAGAMRPILILAAAVLVFGAYAAQFADQAITNMPPQRAAAAVQPELRGPEPTGYGRSMTLDADQQGHFRVEARIDGRSLAFMIDTGASLVILRESAAAEVGIHPMPVNYIATVATANGKVNAAPAKLDRVRARRHLRVRRAGAGVARRGAVAKPTRRFLPLQAQALRIRQRPHGPRAVGLFFRRRLDRTDRFAGVRRCAMESRPPDLRT
jgi:aspartyl protease family protein